MISFVYIIITIFLDNILNTYINFNYHDLTLFTPMLITISLIFLYLLIKNKSIYILTTIIIGIITDILYNNCFINLYLYLLLSLIIILFYKKRDVNLINIIVISLLVLILYDSLIFFSLATINYGNYTIYDLIYKIKNSIILNIGYALISYLILHKSLKKTNKY